MAKACVVVQAKANTPRLRQTEKLDFTAKTSHVVGSTQARLDSISTFWNRLNGTYNLKISDIDRIEDLGKNVVAGTPNCRLVGGRWRYISRPVDGDSVYTDFYGRCGEQNDVLLVLVFAMMPHVHFRG